MRLYLVTLLVLTLFALSIAKKSKPSRNESPQSYQFGAGSYDITGPTAEVGMMGYAMVGQKTAGLHYRLRARAFVISDGKKRICFVSTDSCMIFTGVKQKVIEKLQYIYGDDVYTYDNVAISGEHTHAGPAGYSFHLLYDITSFGFYKDNFDTIVNGIVKAIQQATTNFEANQGANIFVNSGELLDSSVNRSPGAYLANPSSERAQYKYNVDKTMSLLRFQDLQGNELGMVNWFAVHGTSMNNTNTLVSGDNKGYAAYLFEKWKNGNTSLPGNGPFVGAFAQSNTGDVSPNTKGAFCDNGDPCEVAHSTCNGRSQNCHAYGPGKTDFESTQIIGRNQFLKAQELYNSVNQSIYGPIDYIHTFVDMSNVIVGKEFTSTGRDEVTCTAALGDSFAGGTTDGPGDFDFEQGVNNTHTNPYWNFIASILSNPTPEQIKCQYPKPILLNTGGMNFPVPWTAAILPLQILRIGQFFIVSVPAEFTTMAGRRLRDTIRTALFNAGVTDNNTMIVIAGLTNAYSHYTTTYEEYSFQRYEGANTLYGPNTLAAYQQEYTKLATALAQGQQYPPGPTPPDLSSTTYSFITPVIMDDGPFGEVFQDVDSSYSIGDTVEVIFYGANPRNDFRTQQSYLTVEWLNGNNWQVVLTDSDWDTKFYWMRRYIAESLVTITWDISEDTAPGTYRIRTFGSSKDLFGTITPYTGTSSTFTVY